MSYKSIILIAALFLTACRPEPKSPPFDSPIAQKTLYKKFHGKTMGTTYSVTFHDPENVIVQSQIDSALVEINLSLSTYIDSSTVSKINNGNKYGEKVTLLVDSQYKESIRTTLPHDMHFITNFEKAGEIYRNSDGYFDPTVMPLVNYWGFGYDPKVPVTEVDSSRIKSILKTIGFEKFTLEHDSKEMVIIKPKGAELDFSAIAKGYAVDYLGKLLASANIVNYMVEIGGEVVAAGKSPSAQPWKVGLNTPKEDASLTDFSGIVQLQNIALASSGNYRIFHKVNGKKYGHELNPKTGFPKNSEVLGVSVIAPTCMEADAVATACMVLDLKSAYKYISDYQQLEACFFTSNSEGKIISKITPGFSKYLVR